MADVQKYFEEFHEKIRVDYEMSSTLREKRDIIVRRIRDYLQENDLPGFVVLLQGSYKMKTGVVPIAELEYDIDVGLRFALRPSEYSAATVRQWILEAVEGHTDKIDDKGPCIRVTYSDGYHIDLVCYAAWEEHGQENFRLAHKTKGWREADPPALLEYVKKHREQFFAETEDNATKTDQFRRCVRYLRRRNDIRLPVESKAKPTGLAFVLLAIQHGLASSKFIDGRSDDRRALETLTRSISQLFGRVVAKKPTPEYEDMFGRLSDKEIEKFKQDMKALADALKFAGQTADPVEACKKLAELFGDDFPVPEAEESARATRAPAIITTSRSA